MTRFGMTLAVLALATIAHAKEPGGAVLQLAGPNEPGERMVVAGKIWKADGRHVAGNERVLVYHTDHNGDYGSRPNATAAQGTRDARLSGWLTTDPEGHYEVRTIRPGPYRSGDVPAHIHFVLGGSNMEVQFLDDPRVDATDRKNASRDGAFALVRPATKDAKGTWRVSKDFRMPH